MTIKSSWDELRERWQIDPASGKVVIPLDALREIVFIGVGAGTAPLLEDHPDYVFPSERVAANVERLLADLGLHDPTALGT